MAEEVVEGEEKKGKGPIVMIIVAGVVLLVLLAGAIGGTLFATGFFDSKDKKAAEAKIAELEAGKGDGHGGGGHGAKDDGHGGKGDGHGAPAPAGGASGTAPVSKTAASMQRFEYRYVELEKDLLANLSGSKKVMSVKVAIMTRYDERVTSNIKKHEFALRSVAMDVLRQVKPEEVDLPEFRKRLAERLRDEMNQTLQKLEDFGGIEEIVFTNFIVQ